MPAHSSESTPSRPLGPTRRDFLARTTLGLGAVTLPGPLDTALRAVRADDPPARAVIQIFLSGGLSHIDTFDPKPDAPVEVRGPFGPTATKLDDVRFTSLCRASASVADRLVLVRSCTHTEAAHERGRHNMLTGYRPSPAISYPSFGAVVAHELGSRDDLPPYVSIPNAGLPDLGTGYLSSAYGPFSVGGEPSDRNFKVRDLVPPSNVDPERLARRRRMLADLDGGFAGDADAIVASASFYGQAWKLIESASARDAFKVELEDKKTRDRYGQTRMGQRLLLARRLAEAGVRYTTVVSGGWDHHDDVYNGLRGRFPDVDRAFAALVADLDERGTLDSTLVLLTTEFGRTPRLNSDRGRDHWPRVFTTVLAGGGLKRGIVVGASDASGAEPERDPVRPSDLAATVFRQLGIDPSKRLMSPGDRPIDIVRDGRVLREILA